MIQHMHTSLINFILFYCFLGDMIVYHQSNRDRSVMKLEPKRVSNLSRISPFSFFLDSFHQMRITHVKLLSGSSSFSDEFFFRSKNEDTAHFD